MSDYQENLQINSLLKKQTINYVPQPPFRHTSAADQQAFDNLWKLKQDVEALARRGIKAGERGHKSALQEIARLCRNVE